MPTRSPSDRDGRAFNGPPLRLMLPSDLAEHAGNANNKKKKGVRFIGALLDRRTNEALALLIIPSEDEEVDLGVSQ